MSSILFLNPRALAVTIGVPLMLKPVWQLKHEPLLKITALEPDMETPVFAGAELSIDPSRVLALSSTVTLSIL